MDIFVNQIYCNSFLFLIRKIHFNTFWHLVFRFFIMHITDLHRMCYHIIWNFHKIGSFRFFGVFFYQTCFFYNVFNFFNFGTNWIICNLRFSFFAKIISSSDAIIMLPHMITQMNYRIIWNRFHVHLSVTWIINLMNNNIKLQLVS